MSSSRTVVLDTSPLVLWVVGAVRPELLGCTPHLKTFTPDDVLVLEEFLVQFQIIATTPHVATEVAYFISKAADRRDPILRALRAQFANLAQRLPEVQVTSRSATARHEFAWLDLADCTLLEATGPQDVLLTTDAKLAYRRLELGLPAVNFNELREKAGLL